MARRQRAGKRPRRGGAARRARRDDPADGPGRLPRRDHPRPGDGQAPRRHGRRLRGRDRAVRGGRRPPRRPLRRREGEPLRQAPRRRARPLHPARAALPPPPARRRRASQARDSPRSRTATRPQAESLLASLVDDYPDGDMRGEALFRLALARMVRGRLERRDRSARSRDRSLEAGDRRQPERGARGVLPRARVGDDGRRPGRRSSLRVAHPPRSARVLHDAGVRAARRDGRGRARRALDGAVEGETHAPAALLTRDHPELHAPVFTRGLALLEVGEIDDARRELARVLGDAADPEVVWTRRSSTSRRARPTSPKRWSRASLGELMAHYPAGAWQRALGGRVSPPVRRPRRARERRQ